MYTKNAELKAGIVVVAALAALLFFLFRAGGSELPWAERREVWLRFEQGFAAPKTDDPVYMNGFKIGRVSRVWQAEESRSGERLTQRDRARLKLKPGEDGVAREIYILAAVQMPPEQKIPRGTTGEISVDLTGGRKLALLPGLERQDLSDEDTRRVPIPTSAAGDLSSIQRAVEDMLVKVGDVAGNANLVLSDVRSLVQDLRAKVDAIDTAAISGNVVEASKSLRDAIDAVRGRVDEIATKVSAAADNLRTMTADGATLVKASGEDVKVVLANLKDLSASLKDLVARLGPRIETTLDEVAGAARSARAAVEEFGGLGTKVKAIVGEAGVDIDRFLATLTEGAHNLADATEDLRANPWKLANRPEEKEIRFENLRNAAGNFVRAASALQATIADLKLLEERKDLADEERKTLLQAAAARLRADLGRYEEAARRFNELLASPDVKAPR